MVTWRLIIIFLWHVQSIPSTFIVKHPHWSQTCFPIPYIHHGFLVGLSIKGDGIEWVDTITANWRCSSCQKWIYIYVYIYMHTDTYTQYNCSCKGPYIVSQLVEFWIAPVCSARYDGMFPCQPARPTTDMDNLWCPCDWTSSEISHNVLYLLMVVMMMRMMMMRRLTKGFTLDVSNVWVYLLVSPGTQPSPLVAQTGQRGVTRAARAAQAPGGEMDVL